MGPFEFSDNNISKMIAVISILLGMNTWGGNAPWLGREITSCDAETARFVKQL